MSLTTDQGFAFVGDRQAKILVLGSMPGQASLRVKEYYAHPRNAFWDIMQVLFDIPRSLSYAVRLQRLKKQGVALWDVLNQCQRPGSLDSNIVNTSILPNNFNGILKKCPHMHTVFFNGGKAGILYKKHVLLNLEDQYQSLTLIQLPSTSPAHASMTIEQKIKAWAVLKAV